MEGSVFYPKNTIMRVHILSSIYFKMCIVLGLANPLYANCGKSWKSENMS